MGTILVQCPATGRRASTGIETTAEDFDKIPEQLRGVTCPACGMRHVWFKHDAWLAKPTQILEMAS